MADFRILKGPSKFDLMVALFVGVGGRRHLVSFFVRHNRCVNKELHMEVIIQGVERSREWPGSDRFWKFNGLWVRYGMPKKPVSGSYFTSDRTGTVTFEEE